MPVAVRRTTTAPSPEIIEIGAITNDIQYPALKYQRLLYRINYNLIILYNSLRFSQPTTYSILLPYELLTNNSYKSIFFKKKPLKSPLIFISRPLIENALSPSANLTYY